jgi:hypothetical protein
VIINTLADRIVRDDVDDHVLIACVDELMRLAGFEEEGVTCFDRRRSLRVAHLSRTRDDVIELPLGAVRMERIWDLSRGLRPSASETPLLNQANFRLGDSDDSSAMLRLLTFFMAGTRVFHTISMRCVQILLNRSQRRLAWSISRFIHVRYGIVPVNRGVDIRVIQGFLGHRSTTSATRYAALNGQQYAKLF